MTKEIWLVGGSVRAIERSTFPLRSMRVPQIQEQHAV